MTTAEFSQVDRTDRESADFPFPVHTHVLRHACGYKLANDEQDIRLQRAEVIGDGMKLESGVVMDLQDWRSGKVRG